MFSKLCQIKRQEELDELVDVGGYLWLFNLTHLETLHGLDGLQHVGGNLDVDFNEHLQVRIHIGLLASKHTHRYMHALVYSLIDRCCCHQEIN